MKRFNKITFFSLLISALLLSGCTDRNKVVSLDKEEMYFSYNTLQNHNINNVDAVPNTGNPKLLVVPIWFTDSSNYITTSEKKDTVREDIKKTYFGTDEETGWKSVRTFYEEESYGKVSLTGVVTDWYEVGKSSHAFYYDLDLIVQTVSDAVDWYKTESGDDALTSFDTDHNGFLDGVILIYGAPDSSASLSELAEYMWAFTYWVHTTEKDVDYPNPNTFFWASYDFMYGNSKLTPYHSGDTRYATLDSHTFIHEMGHVFGLDDYYDYSGKYLPAGGFSMQDFNVGAHDPYSVMALGWANPYVPTKSCTVKIKDFRSSGDLILLTPEFHNSPFDEYLLLEFYTPTGLNEFDTVHKYRSLYPRGPVASGIRLWHVDGRLIHLKEGESHLGYNPTSQIVPGRVYTHLMSNTYYAEDVEGYISPLGKYFENYNLLQLIRNDEQDTFKPTSSFENESLFRKGHTFTMDKYSKQFVKGNLLNSDLELGWSFIVQSISKDSATIKLIRD